MSIESLEEYQICEMLVCTMAVLLARGELVRNQGRPQKLSPWKFLAQ